MSLSSIYMDVSLPFDAPEDRDDSEYVLLQTIGINARINKMHLRKGDKQGNPYPLLYESGIVYTKPDQSDGRRQLSSREQRKLINFLKDAGQEPETALMCLRIIKGIEIFLGVPELIRRGKGDCNELVPMRLAELWRAGVAASPYLTRQARSGVFGGGGGYVYHAIIQYEDGSSEDPSAILGMGDPATRLEEIRKNVERWQTRIDAAQRMLSVDGAYAPNAAAQIDQMGFVPRNGVFKSPYSSAA